MPLCRVPETKTLGKDAFCRVPKNSTRQNTSLPSVRKKALGKDAFCRVPKNDTRQNTSLPSAEKKYSAKPSLSSVFFAECILFGTRQRGFCQVPDKIHSAKPPALGKVPVSGSVEGSKG